MMMGLVRLKMLISTRDLDGDIAEKIEMSGEMLGYEQLEALYPIACTSQKRHGVGVL